MKTRRFLSGILTQCYQNTVNGFLLFYSISDHLVYFTNFCVYALKYGIRVLSLCQMPDHIHCGIMASSAEDLSAFIRDVSVAYAKSDAIQCHRTGSLFNRSFGSAPKQGSKKGRTNLIYIGNNPVERQLCSKVLDYRWNYLAYGRSDHPFSEKLVVRDATWALKKALKEIRDEHRRRQPLSYPLLQRLFRDLGQKERFQLIDYIITTYSVIDYDYASRFFDGFDQMIKAMEFNTGSEYDINEVFVGRSDACYAQISKWLMGRLNLNDIHDIFSLPISERTDLLMEMNREMGVSLRQLAKYLRLEIKDGNEGEAGDIAPCEAVVVDEETERQ